MDETQTDQKSRALRLLIVSLLILLVVTVVLSRDFERIKLLIRNAGYAGIAISVLLYGLMGATVVPSEPLTVLNGVLFGPFNATLIAGAGNTLAALIEYFIGTRLASVSAFAQRKAQLPLGLGKAPIDSPLFLLGGRMVPGAGPKMVSLLSGMYRVPMLRYLWTTAVSTFLGAALFAYGGFGLFHLVR